MKTIKTLLLLVLITSQSALAFNQKIDTVVVNHENCKVLQIIVTIENTDKETLWLWYDNHEYGLDYRKAIRKFLMKRRGDFSIFDIGTDPNMFGEWWHPDAPKDAFVKCLEPCKTFTIVFYQEIPSTFNSLESKHIIRAVKIFSNQQIKEACSGIEETYSVKRISYPYSVILFPMK